MKRMEQAEDSSPDPSFSICDIRIQKQMSQSFGKSFPPQKIVLPKLRPQCVPPPARILGGQNTKEKCPFLFQEKFHHHIGEARNIFLWCCRMKRGSGGTIHSTSGFCSKCVRISSYRGSQKQKSSEATHRRQNAQSLDLGRVLLVLLRSDKNFLGMKFETRIIRVSLLPEKKFEFQLYRKFEFA